MAWNGTGTFTRAIATLSLSGASLWTAVKGLARRIRTDDHDEHDEDLATGINNCLTKDGQNAATANLNLGGFRYTAGGAATARTDLARADQVQDSSLTFGGTAGGTADALTISLTPALASYTSGLRVTFRAASANATTTPTLNVNGVGAKTIAYAEGGALGVGDLFSGGVYTVTYHATADKFLLPGNSPYASRATHNLADNILQRPVIKDYGMTRVSANSSTAYTVDLESGNVFDITLTGNCTFTFSNPPASGTQGSFELKLTQDGTGGRSVTWPASVKWPGAAAPTLSTTASKRSRLSFTTEDGGTTWDGTLLGDAFA